jgi:Fe-S cluster assembly ATP-binding protein
VAKLVITDLWVQVDGQDILKGVDLTISDQETVALLGPNGHGKSTLLGAIMGHPKYTITRGSVTLDGADLLAMSRMSDPGKDSSRDAKPQRGPGVVNPTF